MLKVRNLNVHYGSIHAVRDVSFDVPAGRVVTIIGSNGAGKSTILKTVAGLLRPSSGEIKLEGVALDRLPAYRRVSRGLALCPEGRRVFPRLTVSDNLLMGAFTRTRRELDAVSEEMYAMFPILKERSGQLAGTLSGGEQQMLAIARSLASRPKILLLDEPSMGLAPLVVEKVADCIQTIRQRGVTILLVEQNASLALDLADVAYVLETGSVTLVGPAAELLENPAVRAAYLGEIVAQ
jgi:branched-chain amino acid transport system ATP-binding protein